MKQNIRKPYTDINGEGPLVSVIVPCRNEKNHIEVCIRSILGQERPPGGFEIIIADGMSDDGTREILQKIAATDKRLRVVDNPKKIVSTALNAGIKEAKGKIIVRIDAHTEYASDYIRQCLAVLNETGAANVGGPARTKAYTYMQSVICAAYHSFFSVGGARFHNINYEGYVDTVPYGCWPRKLFDRIGLFDEELIRNQDDEFNLRITKNGGKIWQSPRIRSWYKPRGSLQSLFLQYMQYGYWKVRIIQKHKLPASIRHLIPGYFVLSLAVLSMASLLWPTAAWIWLGLAGTYSLGNFAASFLAAATNRWSFLPLLPLAFATYHFGYGYGFLRGIWDFVILRRKPSPAFAKLTRAQL